MIMDLAKNLPTDLIQTKNKKIIKKMGRLA